ncbi:hypothetical protein LVJ94_49265 [Pendulispora rubella]|uniref:UBA domain-containing protein n=1 Tax=Pendulispora rubella TaxID=2741070 RepID=A0ABZ2L3E9_9BACT
MADSKLVDDLQTETGKTREECEAALNAANGDYNTAKASLNLYKPSGVDVDAGGDVYIADTNNHRVRRAPS